MSLAPVSGVCVVVLGVLGVMGFSRRLHDRAENYLLQDKSRFDPMHDECGLEEDERRVCGKKTYETEECQGLGCCYRPCSGCAKEIPWCFLAKRMLREECAVAYEEKDDCGYYGILEGECIMRDCCWRPSGLPNDPACFKKKYSSIRLVDGERLDITWSGRVEILHDDVWGTVCDDGFSQNEAKVVCGSLGYEFYRAEYFRFSEGIGTLWLDGVSCTGEEETLAECGHSGWGEHDCTHSEDVGVTCSSEVLEIDNYGKGKGGKGKGGPDYYGYNYNYGKGKGGKGKGGPDYYGYNYNYGKGKGGKGKGGPDYYGYNYNYGKGKGGKGKGGPDYYEYNYNYGKGKGGKGEGEPDYYGYNYNYGKGKGGKGKGEPDYYEYNYNYGKGKGGKGKGGPDYYDYENYYIYGKGEG